MKIICIDTSGQQGWVAISDNGNILAIRHSNVQEAHASFIQPAIADLMQQEQLSWDRIDAVAVSNGPGSYTGLRVGMAAAKGLCFALQLPLITVSTLDAMALAMSHAVRNPAGAYLLCPMIDARRMEVFTAVYESNLQVILPPAPVILDSDFLEAERKEHIIYYAGTGALKWIQCSGAPEQSLITEYNVAEACCAMAADAFNRSIFADTALSVPAYGKAFHHSGGQNKNNPQS